MIDGKSIRGRSREKMAKGLTHWLHTSSMTEMPRTTKEKQDGVRGSESPTPPVMAPHDNLFVCLVA